MKNKYPGQIHPDGGKLKNQSRRGGMPPRPPASPPALQSRALKGFTFREVHHPGWSFHVRKKFELRSRVPDH